jgi:hypothetical protein
VKSLLLPPVTREYQDKKLRVTFEDGESADVKVLIVSECSEHEECRGITYAVISSSCPNRFKPRSSVLDRNEAHQNF